MFVDDQTYQRDGKTYRRALLRNSYRVNGSVRHDTIANISKCHNGEINAIKFALAHKDQLKNITTIIKGTKTKQGLTVGSLWLLRAPFVSFFETAGCRE